MSEPLTAEEQQMVMKTVLQANERGWGIAFGLLLGVSLFVATNVLILKASYPIGPHLGLLRVYFPGYSVTFLGSLIGFVYAFVVGYLIGRSAVMIYNRVAVKMR